MDYEEGIPIVDEDVQVLLEECDDPLNYSGSESECDSESSVLDDIAVADAVMEHAIADDEDNFEVFNWETMDNYVSLRENFTEISGPQDRARNTVDIVECFELFFDRDLVNIIVKETNRYAEKHISERGSILPSLTRSHRRSWQPVDENEIYVLFGLYVLMGIVRKPTIKLYFSKKRVISTPGFSDMMSRERFELLNRYLHFVDNERRADFDGPTKLFKIFPILSRLNRNFQSQYIPDRNIAINESMPLWKGRLSFRQYLPLKASKFGIKTFELCESESGYLWSVLVYTGKDTAIKSPYVKSYTSKRATVVMKLVEPLLGKGYTLWMDNFYNSPSLACLLKNHSTDCVGTLKLSRKDVPKVLKEKKLKKGETTARHAGPVSIIKWHDKKVVTMISTYHKEDKKLVISRGRQTEKPVCVLDYNKYMGVIDLEDQMLQPYSLDRKCMQKWYIKLFRRLLNIAVINSFIIYKKNIRKPMDLLSFTVQLVEDLFLKYAVERGGNVGGRQASDNNVPRLTERHFIRKVKPKGTKSRPQRRCVVCSKHGKRKDTVYCCSECDVGLCLAECFETYHTKLNY
ncbi:hypothetical protein J437_LFUL003183 [Ladona fulva]|uniref:Transposase n=1 Tax=Ladona fulva TaxID=123851 RepID=A0A8K0JZ48_LADFU|nr:hypothetical protein J437_LFUL003183 [Ladona fulva]